MNSSKIIQISNRLSIAVVGLAMVACTFIPNIPQLEKKITTSTEKEVIQMTEKQVVRISTKGDGLAHIKLNVTENGQYLDFCEVSDRHVNFQQMAPLSITPASFDANGFAQKQIGFTVAWNHLTPNMAFFGCNLIHLDSDATLRFIKLDPALNTTNVYYTLRLDKKIVVSDMMVNPAFIVQVGSNIFISYQTTENTIKILRVYNDKSYLKSQDVDNNIALSTEKGDLTDMTSYLLASGDFLLFILQDESLTTLYLDSTSKVVKILLVTEITSGKKEKEFNSIRLWEDTERTLLNIYVLCGINGLYRFTYIYQGITREQAVLFDSNFFIQISNAEVFNLYKGRNFFITTNSDLYQVREYELKLNADPKVQDYYLNRVHEVDHKIKDIVVYDFFIVILGSNSHTISWHSVHPTLIKNMTQAQQYFSAFSLQGGVVLQLQNSTSLKYEPYFVGFQRYHIFMVKIVSVNAFISCDPQKSQQDVVGEHVIKIGFITQDWVNSNSYIVQENQVERILQINRVYADSLTAGAIAGIVISVVVVIVVIIVWISIKIKRQKQYKYTLQTELDSKTKNRRNSFVPLQQQASHTEVTPNNKRHNSEANFEVDSEKIIKAQEHIQKTENEHEDNQIIKFNEDEE